MDHSQNIYGLFVVYRYLCIDVIIINSTIGIFNQTCFDLTWLCTDSQICTASSILTYYDKVYYIGF